MSKTDYCLGCGCALTDVTESPAWLLCATCLHKSLAGETLDTDEGEQRMADADEAVKRIQDEEANQ